MLRAASGEILSRGGLGLHRRGYLSYVVGAVARTVPALNYHL